MAIEAPNYTQLPNAILDTMADMDDTELRVTLAIARKTFGWHKRADQLSISQLVELTGLSRQGVQNGIGKALARGHVAREKRGQSFMYSLDVMQLSSTVAQETMQLSSTELCNSVARLEPELCNSVGTQKKGSKKERKIAPRDAAASDEMKISKHPLTLKVAEICRIDQATATHETKQQLYQSTKILLEQGCTVEEARAAALDWFTHDWRAGAKSLPIRQKNPPTPAQLRERVGGMRVAAKSEELDAARVARDDRNRETDAQIEKLKQTPVMTPEQAREWRKSMFAMTGD